MPFMGIVFSQDPQQVVQYQENNKTSLIGASVFWKNTIGTITDIEGTFRLERAPDTNLLIISYIGFRTDTLKISTPHQSPNDPKSGG